MPLTQLMTLPAARANTLAWVLRNDYGVALSPPKRNRFEKLAAALDRQMHH